METALQIEHWQAVKLTEQYLGEEHPETAAYLTYLAVWYERQGRYEESKSLHRRALVICERQLGEEHPYTASRLHKH
ncbi:tetratricopeptide repeat protein [Ktedonosporobacter rubrisoli]|uniref:Tetratricopeptide repeat protein n=1 Tax=Ktedonosporobacter rubrisoli TaxID=2509675 RepID=A0A4P6K3T8_KTERU|nr:tetratricopeptide repeat protein [Ktedonosporobacter rubrisoli]QBD82632.1 tetratricopeptide repeat protein [Ktedonosporobacter rubrisoli]